MQVSNNIFTFVSAISHAEVALGKAADSINNDGLGFPPLTALAQFIISPKGKQLGINTLKAAKVFTLVVAFLAIASVMGMVMVSNAIAEFCYGLWIEKGQAMLEAPQVFHVVNLVNTEFEFLAEQAGILKTAAVTVWLMIAMLPSEVDKKITTMVQAQMFA